jgi:hypothetical protein
MEDNSSDTEANNEPAIPNNTQTNSAMDTWSTEPLVNLMELETCELNNEPQVNVLSPTNDVNLLAKSLVTTRVSSSSRHTYEYIIFSLSYLFFGTFTKLCMHSLSPFRIMIRARTHISDLYTYKL